MASGEGIDPSYSLSTTSNLEVLAWAGLALSEIKSPGVAALVVIARALNIRQSLWERTIPPEQLKPGATPVPPEAMWSRPDIKHLMRIAVIDAKDFKSVLDTDWGKDANSLLEELVGNAYAENLFAQLEEDYVRALRSADNLPEEWLTATDAVLELCERLCPS